MKKEKGDGEDMKKTNNVMFWILVWGLGIAGQLCWNMENQWFNTFVYAKIAKDPTIISWMVGVSAADLLPEKKYEQQYLDLLDIAQECGLEMVPSYNGISGDAILPRVIKPCPADKYWKETRKGAFADILFVQTIENAPKYVDIMMQAAAEYGIDPGDVGVYLQPQHQGVSAQIEFTIAFDPENIVESRNARALFDEASARLSRNGAFFAKPYGKWARLQYNKDAQTTIMIRRLKDIFNPNNILNPGKLTDY